MYYLFATVTPHTNVPIIKDFGTREVAICIEDQDFDQEYLNDAIYHECQKLYGLVPVKIIVVDLDYDDLEGQMKNSDYLLTLTSDYNGSSSLTYTANMVSVKPEPQLLCYGIVGRQSLTLQQLCLMQEHEVRQLSFLKS